MIGVVILIGVVVNNAILLVDQANYLRYERHLALRDALLEAGRTRLRPILMTALTTILGLIPLAVAQGEGAQERETAEGAECQAVVGAHESLGPEAQGPDRARVAADETAGQITGTGRGRHKPLDGWPPATVGHAGAVRREGDAGSPDHAAYHDRGRDRRQHQGYLDALARDAE